MRIYTTLILLLLVLGTGFRNSGFAQISRKSKGNRKQHAFPFMNSQLWIGLKAGGNVTKAVPTERYTVFVSTLPDHDQTYQKKYDKFGTVSSQIGLVTTYNFRTFFSLSFQPAYINRSFGYRNEYSWLGKQHNSVELSQHHQFKLSYLELPLLVRFDLIRTRLRPYLQAGGFYSRLLKADKHMELTSSDHASGAANPIENNTPTIGVQNSFIRSNMGWMAGGGISYDIGNARIGIDAVYKSGTNNITNVKNRYSDNRMTSNGDVFDDMKLRNIDISISLLFPMKYLETKSFRSVKP
jgi:hypothetical protein